MPNARLHHIVAVATDRKLGLSNSSPKAAIACLDLKMILC